MNLKKPFRLKRTFKLSSLIGRRFKSGKEFASYLEYEAADFRKHNYGNYVKHGEDFSVRYIFNEGQPDPEIWFSIDNFKWSAFSRPKDTITHIGRLSEMSICPKTGVMLGMRQIVFRPKQSSTKAKFKLRTK